MRLHDEGLVAFVGTAGVHIVTHHIEDEVQVVILAESIVIPLQRVVSSHQALEETLRGIEILVKRFGTVVRGLMKSLEQADSRTAREVSAINIFFISEVC
jgi:hypothetical protein